MDDISDIFPEFYFDDVIRPPDIDFEEAIDNEDDLFYFC